MAPCEARGSVFRAVVTVTLSLMVDISSGTSRFAVANAAAFLKAVDDTALINGRRPLHTAADSWISQPPKSPQPLRFRAPLIVEPRPTNHAAKLHGPKNSRPLAEFDNESDIFYDVLFRPVFDDAVNEYMRIVTTEDGQGIPTVAELSGITQNRAGDWASLACATFLNGLLVIACAAFVSVARTVYPLVYANNERLGAVPFALPSSWLGWWKAGWQVSIDEVAKTRGLDQAMLLEYIDLCMNLLCFIGIPVAVIIGPLHIWFGGSHVPADDYLNKLGMENVGHNKNWLYWIHAFFVWFVVVSTQRFIFKAQESFLKRRWTWLKEMPAPRATTIMVEGIPRKFCSDDCLQAYFDTMLGRSAVDTATIVRYTGELRELIRQLQVERQTLDEALFYEGMYPSVDALKLLSIDDDGSIALGGHDLPRSIADSKGAVEELEAAVDRERKRILNTDPMGPDGPNVFTSRGFVTFKDRRDTEIALRLQYRPNRGAFATSVAPDPSDVLYEHLQLDPAEEASSVALGHLCICLLFIFFTPVVVGIGRITSWQTLTSEIPTVSFALETKPAFKTLWCGIVGAVSLNFFMSYVPMLLAVIFRSLYALRSAAWTQHRIQQVYFGFLLVFVLLVTAITRSLAQTVQDLVLNPMKAFGLLSSTMPRASHFYLMWIPVRWSAHALALTRYWTLAKFLAFRSVNQDERARELAEPEDQAYNGIGSRSAQFTLMLVVCLTFSTLAPIVCLLGLVGFVISRGVYGYLVVFVETRKPDLGGVFWVTKLAHTQQGLFIYIMLMSGVLHSRATVRGPGLVAGLSLVYWFVTYKRFFRAFRWHLLPLAEIRSDSCSPKRAATRSTYWQPELRD
eukprot:TRINITY_DN67627_c0_g1_i1.p1 TRINITY_DN67627_c0_g1~~TRINITY_DN67627_c0_g1_i1.p1  ORF type:complete len:852 (-),score=79.60 TRINITY_DN67627_c0_g1_i1:121-2676(-)